MQLSLILLLFLGLILFGRRHEVFFLVAAVEQLLVDAFLMFVVFGDQSGDDDMAHSVVLLGIYKFGPGGLAVESAASRGGRDEHGSDEMGAGFGGLLLVGFGLVAECGVLEVTGGSGEGRFEPV